MLHSSKLNAWKSNEGRLFMAEIWLQPSAYGDIDYCEDLIRFDLSRIIDIALSYWSDDLVVILL